MSLNTRFYYAILQYSAGDWVDVWVRGNPRRSRLQQCHEAYAWISDTKRFRHHTTRVRLLEGFGSRYRCPCTKFSPDGRLVRQIASSLAFTERLQVCGTRRNTALSVLESRQPTFSVSTRTRGNILAHPSFSHFLRARFRFVYVCLFRPLL